MGAGEILLILVVILLLFGAERLPGMARSLGKALEEFRRSARDLSRDLMNSHPSQPSRDAPPRAPDQSQLPAASAFADPPNGKVKESSEPAGMT